MNYTTSMHDVAWADGLDSGLSTPCDNDAATDCDLAVVGAGFAGVSVALHAAKRGLSTVLLERGTVGCGASGRNAGFVVPHYPGVSPATVEKLLGPARGGALNALVASGSSFVFEQICEHGIECSAVQNGWMQTAHSDKSSQVVRTMLRDWQAFGAEAEYLDQAEVAACLGTSVYRDGWRVPSGGYVNPYALTVGLARVAALFGAAVREQAEVTSMHRDASGYVLETAGSSLLARRLLVATNGYTGPQWGALARANASIRLYTTVSEPLSANLQAQTLPERPCVSDLHAAPRFTRLDEYGRLVSAGMSPLFGDRRRTACRLAEQSIAETYPQLTEPRVGRYWEGYCSFTASSLPNVYRLGPDAYAIGGFSGRGISLAQALGPVLADFMNDSVSEADLPLPVVAPRADPLVGVKRYAAPIVYQGLKALDAMGVS